MDLGNLFFDANDKCRKCGKVLFDVTLKAEGLCENCYCHLQDDIEQAIEGVMKNYNCENDYIRGLKR